MTELDVRIGYGYDVHRLTAGRRMVIGGVDIPYEYGPAGHSDADVLLHALIDALLGAAALADIGSHFPDTDPAYKDADSRVLLVRAREILNDAGFVVVNVDATIILERPKLAPFTHAMRSNVAADLQLEVGRVSVKATTSEGLGFVGNGVGIAAHAVCLIRKR